MKLIQANVGVTINKKGILWRIADFVVTWSIWLEINNRNFNDSFELVEEIWDRIQYTVALWSLSYNLFKGLSLTDFVRNWSLAL